MDVKIYQLTQSNEYLKKEFKDDPDSDENIRENEELILKTKDEVYKILTAFLKAGINLDKEVFPTMPWRELYLSDNLSEVRYFSVKFE